MIREKLLMNYKILIVDDEKASRDGLQKILQFDYDVMTTEDGLVALELIKNNQFDLVLTDVNMPQLNGIELTKEIALLEKPPVVIVLTAYGSVDVAVNAMSAGAFDYLTKPINIDSLEALIKRGLGTIEPKTTSPQNITSMIGKSKSLKKVVSDIAQMAQAKSTVLVTGESGTGKELVATALHELSPRSQKPFITLHCASLNENLLESELFGHEKGAFTGATSQKTGRIEMADGGSLFLDEIGEIDHRTQVKLLRVLESRRFERVGGTEAIDVDIRIICATNRDLKHEVEIGNFREDLYFRLTILNIHLPPLRERREDIIPLLKHYLKFFAKENGREGLSFQDVTLELLAAYHWPGNIRELRNLVERMVVMSRDKMISVAEIPTEIRQQLGDKSAEVSKEKSFNIEDNELELIESALEKNNHNITHTAVSLGISRRTLQRKIKKYGLS